MTDFHQHQRAFTSWIRHPDPSAVPAGLELRRISLYRELLFNNIAGFAESTFPVLQSCLPAEHWERLLSGFFADHRSHSPFFRDIPLEFLTYLQTLPWTEFPWVPELAHFEWAQAAAGLADGDIPDAESGDVWTGVPVLSPFAWPLVYQWPVHRFGEEGPGTMPDVPEALLLFRNDRHEVRMMPVSLPAAALLETLQQAPVPVFDATERMAGVQGLDPVWLRDHLEPWIQAWQAEGIIRGVVPGDPRRSKPEPGIDAKL